MLDFKEYFKNSDFPNCFKDLPEILINFRLVLTEKEYEILKSFIVKLTENTDKLLENPEIGGVLPKSHILAEKAYILYILENNLI